MSQIVATVFIHGHPSGHVNWSDWTFVQIPAPGDIICVQAEGKGDHEYATVRHSEYRGSSIHWSDDEASVIIVCDHKSSYAP